MLACSFSPAPAKKKKKMQCRLRFVPNFIPARQQAVNPLAGSGSQGPHASLRVPQVNLPRGPPQGQRPPGTAGCPAGGPGRGTHPRGGGRARRGSPGPRGRGWVRWPPARAVRGARLRARAAGSAVQSARACRLARRAARPGSRLPGDASSREQPRAARAASGRVAWTRLPWQPELEAFPARPRPARRRPPPAARRVPTPKIASPLAAGRHRAPVPAPGLGGRGARLQEKKPCGGAGGLEEEVLKWGLIRIIAVAAALQFSSELPYPY